MRLTRSMSLGDLESAVMEYCWTAGEGDAKAVHRVIGEPRQITLNTIQSTLKRLYAKGLLLRRKVSHAHIYAPRMSRDEVLLINLSGRGDKDVLSVQGALGPKAERK